MKIGTKLKLIYLIEDGLSEEEEGEIMGANELEKLAVKYVNAVDNSFDSNAMPKKVFHTQEEATLIIDFLTNFC
jgi:hypothetical protein